MEQNEKGGNMLRDLILPLWGGSVVAFWFILFEIEPGTIARFLFSMLSVFGSFSLILYFISRIQKIKNLDW